MERRDFLKLSFGFAAGAAALGASAQAAPLPPVMPAAGLAPPPQGAEPVAQPAVVTQDDVDRLAPEQVRWGRRRRWGFRRRRFWGFRRRRHYGFRRRWRRRRWFW